MLQKISSAVENGKIKEIEAIVSEALDSGISAGDILAAMTKTMEDVGEKFQRNEVFVPEMLVSALTMKKAVAVLKPHFVDGKTASLGKLVIGTVSGDMHDIGKNLVALMMESAGFEVIDLGVDVSPEQFVQAVRENPECKIVGLSSLLTTAMDAMAETVAAIKAAGFGSQVKIMVGGAPITAEFAEKIGADAYTADAGAAAVKAKELIA